MKLDKNQKLLIIGISAFICIFLFGIISMIYIDKLVPKTNTEKIVNQDKEEKRKDFLDSQNPTIELNYIDEKDSLPIIDDDTGKSLSQLLKQTSDGESFNEMSDILNDYQDKYELTDELKQEASQTQSVGLIKDMVKNYLRDRNYMDRGTMRDYINSSIYMIYTPELYVDTLFSLPQIFQTSQYQYSDSYVMECLSLPNNKEKYKLNSIKEAVYKDYSNPIYQYISDVPSEDRERTTHLYLVDFTHDEVDYYLTLYKTKEKYMFALKIFKQNENDYSPLSTVSSVNKHYN